MYRKYIDDLIAWKNDSYRKPLIIWGARQTGKTYLVKELFAPKFYKNNYIYIDCRTESDFVKYCEENLNVKKVLDYLSLYTGKTITKDTLLIFDEAQECLPIITLMKYFCQDYREIPIIVTGSMVRIKIKRDNNKRGLASNNQFLFPVGKINQLTIYPMTYEEFLINSNQPLYDKIKSAYQNKEPLDAKIRELALHNFHDYMLIGGMPEIVNIFLTTKNYQIARKNLIDLYDNYLADMELYQASPEAIIRSKKIFENIFTFLDKESKNFKPSTIEEKARNRDMKSPLDWLTMAFLISQSFQTKENVNIPITETHDNLYRIYLADMGMFSYQSKINPTTFIDANARNKLSGIFYENYVANELTANGFPLHFWKGKNNSEFEFIIEHDNYVIPIIVKKNRGTLNSLEKFKNHNAFKFALKVSSNNYGYNEENNLLTIPFYEFFLFCNEIKNK